MAGLPPHVAFEVHETSQVGEVRRAATALAERLGLDETARGRLALIATELGTNLVRHARGGRLLLGRVLLDDGRPAVELLSLDQGPGMANPQACLADGYSTGGTPGTGLGAVRRLADAFDLASGVPQGTVIMARVGGTVRASALYARPEAAMFRLGAVALAAPGETECGDAWDFAQDGDRACLMVVDGLGHGPYAAEAAEAALGAFRQAPMDGPSRIIERAHEALRTTRGAAIAVARVDRAQDTVVFSGAGNVAGRLVSATSSRSLVSQHGTAGVQIRRLSDVETPWPAHAMLVMHSDGLTTRWDLPDVPGLLQCHPSVLCGWLIRDHCRGRDDATVAVLRRGNGR